ncbi:MAG: replication protein P [Gammaproteobacteria bacterium]|nr:replication protein P [Gammaproteobacteria bacterium]
MQTINPLLEKASKALARPSSASQTEAGPNSHSDSAEDVAREGPDRIDAINQLFAEFELAYHNQYHKAYGSEDRLVMAKKYWLGCLAAYSPLQIVAAARRVVKTHDFLPTISVVVRACEEGAGLFGLPTPREAYIEACRAEPPKAAFAWSHPAVYFAGRAAGWFLLATEPEDRVFPLFEYYYNELCQRAMRGEDLGAPQAVALPEHISRPLSGEENHARMLLLREQLGL